MLIKLATFGILIAITTLLKFQFFHSISDVSIKVMRNKLSREYRFDVHRITGHLIDSQINVSFSAVELTLVYLISGLGFAIFILIQISTHFSIQWIFAGTKLWMLTERKEIGSKVFIPRHIVECSAIFKLSFGYYLSL